MGSGKGGGQTRPVFDYHLSIDYGVCFGPIDHFNKLWIKDKTIFCDTLPTESHIGVEMPELFGGDDKEGGVSGVVEMYTGHNEQYASWELARRMGMNQLEAPGYRGLAHMFFRGALDSSVVESEVEATPDVGGISGMLLTIFSTSFGLLLPTASVRKGWKWSSNNPYLPAAKVSVTRLPRPTFSDPYAAIWPPATIDDNGNLIGVAGIEPGTPVVEDPSGTFEIGIVDGGVVDLHELGFTQASIDAGDAKITSLWSVTLVSYDTYGTGDSTLQSAIKFYEELPDTWDAEDIDPVTGEEALVEVDQVFSLGIAAVESADTIAPAQILATTGLDVVTAPAGSRFLRVRGQITLGDSVVAVSPTEADNYHESWDSTDPQAGYTTGGYGVGYVAVTVGDPPEVPEVPADETLAPPSDTFRPQYQASPVTAAMVPRRTGKVLDLIALGFSAEEIDAGLIYADMEWRGSTYSGVPALPNRTASAKIAIGFHSAYPTLWYQNTTGGVDTDQEGAQLHHHQIEPTMLTPGTRFIQFSALATTAVGQSTSTIEGSLWRVGYFSYGTHHCLGDDLIGTLPDANPARIIYECMTNGEWGKGEDPAMINADTFDVAAETLYNERFGLTLGYFEQDTIENFISEILDHIQAFLFQDPSTGLWSLELLRDDYDVDTLPLLDQSNCVATGRKRKLWGETINEVVVSYTDPQTEKSVTVSAHDLGNIAIQGGVISDTRDYYGVRNELLATFLAQRDVREAGYPLFSCQISVNRSEWNARPGHVRRFSWAEDGIEEIVIRVMAVDYGKPNDRKIMLTVTEDIFSVERAQYGAPQTTEWVNVEREPVDLSIRTAFTVPLPSLVRAGGSIEDIDAGYPVVAGAIFADGYGVKPVSIEVQSQVIANNGSTSIAKITDLTPTYSALLMSEMVQEVSSTLPKSQIDAVLRRDGRAGEFFMLGFSEETSELLMLDTYDDNSRTWTVRRGMWDTVPLSWPRGVRIWYFAESASSTDGAERAAGEDVTYYLLPRTSLGVLPFDGATPLDVTYTERPFAPFRPANAQIDGQGFGGVVVREEPFPTEITATWKNRNRTTEDQVSLSWDDDSAAVEIGQTVTLRITDDLGNIHHDITGLAGESHTFSTALLPPGAEGYVQFLAERDGYTSVFGARRYFDIRPPSGYGIGYGIGYGGVGEFVVVPGALRFTGKRLSFTSKIVVWNP